MRIVMAVIRREYVHRVRSKWFVIGTVAGPLLMIAISAVPIVLGSRGDALDRVIVILDSTDALYESVTSRLGDSFDVERVEFSEGAVARLETRIENREISGFLVLDEGTLSAGRAVFRARERPSALRRIRIRQAVVESALGARLLGASDGEGARALLDGGEVEYRSLDGKGSEENDRTPALVAGFVGGFILYMAIIIYGIQVMRAVLEEKATRIVEIIISVLRPWQLMLGKILGVGAVGLTQLGIWALSVVLLVTLGLPYLVTVRPELVELRTAVALLPKAGGIALFLTFFVLGYFLFSSLYAAVDEVGQSAVVDSAPARSWPLHSSIACCITVISSTSAAAATGCASTPTSPRSSTRLLRSRALHPPREREQEQRRKRRTRGSSPPPSVQFSMARPVQLSMAVDTSAAVTSWLWPGRFFEKSEALTRSGGSDTFLAVQTN